MTASALPRTDERPTPSTEPVPRPRRPRRTTTGSRSPLDVSAVDRSVACVFCREPIAMSSFVIGERQARTGMCPNCGLMVSVAPAVWALWTQAEEASEHDRSLAERLRARRVAAAARLIRERVALTTPYETSS